jgi:hypothetical protein
MYELNQQKPIKEKKRKEKKRKEMAKKKRNANAKTLSLKYQHNLRIPSYIPAHQKNNKTPT